MIALALFGSVVALCIAALYALHSWYEFMERARQHKDVLLLASHLEEKLKAMDEIKAQMQNLLLKNGFGR